jgi:tetratricopeptide (TPR) repeat protein
MAIERIEGTPKVEWTPATLIQLGAAVVLILLSGLFGWLAFSNWRFKVNLVEGYQENDRGRSKAAKQPLLDALSWRPKHTGARELLAKILCDEGKLDEARKQYTILALQGYNVPQVHIGIGVIALKEVEELDKPKAIEAKVAEADAEFRKAAGVPEAEIGRGHCELVLARKLEDPSHYAKAQALFAKVRTAMDQSREFRAGITRDGLVDYYTGLGKALSSGEKYDEGARDAFRACFQYTGSSWGLPMANVLSLEARRFSQFAEGGDVLLKLQPDINALRNQAVAIWKSIKNAEDKEEIREPWLMFSLALAQAWGRAGNVVEMSNITKDLIASGGFEQRMEPALLDAQIRTELALRDDTGPAIQESAVTKATASYNDLIQRLPNDDANKERRARAFNNAAWTLAWRGGYTSSDSLYTQAQQRLMEALRLFPDDYVYNRNMAIILKRFKKTPVSPQAYIDKCRAAASKDKDLAEDFDKLQKYMETK